MNKETSGNMLIGLGIVFTTIGIILIPIINIHDTEQREIAELKEAQYMQEKYGYEDNMDEYLEYLKVNNFREYLHLKSIHEKIHSYERYHISYGILPIPLIFGGLFGCIFIGSVIRE